MTVICLQAADGNLIKTNSAIIPDWGPEKSTQLPYCPAVEQYTYYKNKKKK